MNSVVQYLDDFENLNHLTEKNRDALFTLVRKQHLNAPAMMEFMKLAFPRYPITTIDRENLYSVEVLKRDLKASETLLTARQARFLVDTYYHYQTQRIRANNQDRDLGKSDEPHECIEWACREMERLEDSIKVALEQYVRSSELGQRVLGVYGIGPVLAAGLLSMIDIHRAPTAGAIWRFAGLDPTLTWGKGQKRPWNARLKNISWKVGDSFRKFHKREQCYYGHLYAARRDLELERNERLEYREQAEHSLATKKYDKSTEAYKAYIQGKLPPSRIYLRAQRWATKIFLSHYHEVAYKLEFGEDPPKPFAIAHLGHVHMYPVPW